MARRTGHGAPLLLMAAVLASFVVLLLPLAAADAERSLKEASVSLPSDAGYDGGRELLQRRRRSKGRGLLEIVAELIADSAADGPGRALLEDENADWARWVTSRTG
ncbi:hypothetical protein Agub_g13333 [Astrephomene gubernaculifera]|uniref:Uncharacterized protein n=1 Tax=Astrephomene gubernaculifera TaxID=47775 RepID=A0AAD3HS97_9CHLO|nr:hypothetical protein Agub_g13333 [Astrephomene gubernaculifera]